MSTGVGASGELGQQARLPDTGFSDELDRCGAAPVEPGDQPVEERELRGAPDEMLGDGHACGASIDQGAGARELRGPPRCQGGGVGRGLPPCSATSCSTATSPTSAESCSPP